VVFEREAQNRALIHPIKAQEGEIVPTGYIRGYVGLLLKDLK
jgi:hypothetical protein